MKEHTSKKQDARKNNQKASKEPKEKFAFHVGMDLGDKNADVCVLDPDGEDARRRGGTRGEKPLKRFGFRILRVFLRVSLR